MLFDELLKMDLSEIDVEACVEKWPALEEEQRRAREIFKDFPVPELGYTEITKKYNDKETVRRQLELIKNNWHEFKKKPENRCIHLIRCKICLASQVPLHVLRILVSREIR